MVEVVPAAIREEASLENGPVGNVAQKIAAALGSDVK